jgi:hypothetical protein
VKRDWFRLTAVAGMWLLVGLFAACEMPMGPGPGPYPGPPPTAAPAWQPGPGWQRGVMAYRSAMELRRRRRVPVFLFFYRPT